MKLGIQSLQFLSSPERRLADQLDDFIPVCQEAERLGFDWVSASQHWLSAPSVWPQPFPLIARLSAAVTRMRFMTQMLLLPLHNPIDIAEQVATLDHVTRGRIDLGVALGYRETEMTTAGFTRSDRVSRMVESIELLKAAWSGEEVEHEGRWWQVPGGRMGFTPFQQPHPALVLAAQSPAATDRAAKLGDGVFFGPQLRFDDMAELSRRFQAGRDEAGRPPGSVGAGRALIIGDTFESAIESAQPYVEKTFGMYSRWDMQERGMAPLALSGDDDLAQWALVGTPADCVERIGRLADDAGLTNITLTLYNLPSEPRARIEHVQRVGEEIVQPAKRLVEERSA